MCFNVKQTNIFFRSDNKISISTCAAHISAKYQVPTLDSATPLAKNNVFSTHFCFVVLFYRSFHSWAVSQSRTLLNTDARVCVSHIYQGFFVHSIPSSNKFVSHSSNANGSRSSLVVICKFIKSVWLTLLNKSNISNQSSAQK